MKTGDQLDLFGGAPSEAPLRVLAEAWRAFSVRFVGAEDAINEPYTAQRPSMLLVPTRKLARLVVKWLQLAQLSREANLLDLADVSRVNTWRTLSLTT